MERSSTELGRGFDCASRLVRISDLAALEGGTYWPELRPHFLRPEYRRLRYSVQERGRFTREPEAASIRGASSVGPLDVAFIADRYAATLSIAGAGLPDHCLTLVQSGGLICTGLPNATDLRVGRRTGLIYRGWPGTALSASSDHQRIAIWISDSSVRERLSALLGHPVFDDIVFEPLFDWDAPGNRSLRSLVEILLDEFGGSRSSEASESAGRSFADLFVYTLLRSLRHSHTALLERPAGPVLPRIQRRAEAYIEASLEDPIALHEVAAAAGCSVRSLQAGFQRYRNTTPLAFIRAARLRAARSVLAAGLPGTTVTDVALRYGFTNQGRFASQFRRAFGVLPAEVLRTGRQ
jgi:AraC-like DNA-binding protein